ncbi:hypothetical protein LSAT2_012828 [Lamellibrachia satsuma]|nr:hypothetical protein LSAT2_012828 [Lamellibrachia satsuma]
MIPELRECGLTTLETRRLRGDQIEVFKIVNGYEDVDRNMFFKLKEGSRTRGHKAALVKEQLPGKPVFSLDGSVGARNVTLSWQPPSCSTRNRGRVVNYMLELWKGGSEAPDDPPMGLNGIMVTDHQVALSWSSPHTPNGVIQEYEVIARENGTDLWLKTVRSRNLTCEVYGGITYSFTVVAINRIGRSSEAMPISISTPVRAPEQISLHQIQLEQFNETAATLTWSRPWPPHGPINHYIISCHLRDEDHNEVITCNDTRPGNETKMHVFVECNDTKVFMEVRIVAVNHNGTLPLFGRWSEPKSVEMCKNPGIHIFYIPCM